MVERSTAGSSEQGGGLFLPPGFRFHPTDDEVITSYLLQKFLNPSFVSRAVGEVNLNNCEPRDLPSKAKMGEKEWYFFCHKDLKYPTGMRANRATREGYWKATGKDREIFSKPQAGSGELVGMKKTLVFYTGRAPRGAKTNWVMHEFRLHGKSRDQTFNNPKDEWVVCKVFNKKGEAKMSTNAAADVETVEYSAGTTPNVSSVDAGCGEDGDFLDSTIDPLYFTNYEHNSLPAKTTTTNASASPYNADYYSIPTTGTGSFGVMPNYSLTNTASNMQVATMANSVPTSSRSDNSSWNMLPAAAGQAHGMGRSYNINLDQDEQQAIMVKALGGVIGPNFRVAAKGLPSSTSAVAAVSQMNKLGSYGGEYPYGNYDLAVAGAGAGAGAATAVTMNGRPAAAKNLGARPLHY